MVLCSTPRQQQSRGRAPSDVVIAAACLVPRLGSVKRACAFGCKGASPNTCPLTCHVRRLWAHVVLIAEQCRPPSVGTWELAWEILRRSCWRARREPSLRIADPFDKRLPLLRVDVAAGLDVQPDLAAQGVARVATRRGSSVCPDQVAITKARRRALLIPLLPQRESRTSQSRGSFASLKEVAWSSVIGAPSDWTSCGR